MKYSNMEQNQISLICLLKKSKFVTIISQMHINLLSNCDKRNKVRHQCKLHEPKPCIPGIEPIFLWVCSSSSSLLSYFFGFLDNLDLFCFRFLLRSFACSFFFRIQGF